MQGIELFLTIGIIIGVVLNLIIWMDNYRRRQHKTLHPSHK